MLKKISNFIVTEEIREPTIYIQYQVLRKATLHIH